MKQNPTSISVAIATVGRSEPLRRTVRSLNPHHECIDEILIGDQNPDTTAIDAISGIEGEIPVEVIDRPTSETTPRTRNILMDKASADVIAYLDDDTKVGSNWARAILEGYEHESGPAGVGGPAITVDSGGRPTVDIIRNQANQNVFNRYGEINAEWDRWIPPNPVQTDLFIGANMSFDVTKLRDVGGFDEKYSMNAGEELPPMVALRKRGETLLYHPDACVKHYQTSYGGSRPSYEKQSRAYWEGRHLIRLRWNYFHDTFWVGLLRLLLWTEYVPAPAWKLVGAAILDRDVSHLWWIFGYVDGLYKETKIISF